MKKSTKPISKANLFFVLIAALTAIVVSAVLVMSFRIKSVALDHAEDTYHQIDRAYAANFLKANSNNDGEEINGSISFAQDDNCYVGIIGKDGNVFSYASGKNSTITTSNIFKYLNAAKMTDLSYDEAVVRITGEAEGRFDFFSGNQSKVMIYTPVEGSPYWVVRVIPKKLFNESRDKYSKVSDVFKNIVLACVVAIFLLSLFFRNYALKVEDSNAKHNLIAADNDLVSFTYHSSIASFEMTGAVATVFGSEIAKRGQIDWNTFSRILHPDDQMLLRNISKAMKKGDTKYTTEFRLVDSEGEFHWYRMNGKCVFGEDNEVKKFVGTIQNSDDQISHENMLKNKAEHDLLTGLLNKITIQEAVDAVILGGSHSAYAFYIIDLDNFKAVNDNLGHATGDKVLTDVSSKLQLVFNEADYIGRLGGDEFAVLLVIPSMMTSQAEKLIREKAKLLNEILLSEYGDDQTTIRVSASIGIAMYPSDGNDFQSLYQHADRALYHSKENGKNQFTFYTEIV